MSSINPRHYPGRYLVTDSGDVYAGFTFPLIDATCLRPVTATWAWADSSPWVWDWWRRRPSCQLLADKLLRDWLC